MNLSQLDKAMEIDEEVRRMSISHWYKLLFQVET
jgi:hypothetical protein